jgi:hypothetical protein
MQVWQKVSQSLHEQAAQAQAAGGDGEASSTPTGDGEQESDDDVVEGEIVDEGGSS